MITSTSNDDQTAEEVENVEDEDDAAKQHGSKRKGEENNTNAIPPKRSKPSSSDHPSNSRLNDKESVTVPELQEADSTINKTAFQQAQINNRNQPDEESRNNDDNQEATIETQENDDEGILKREDMITIDQVGPDDESSSTTENEKIEPQSNLESGDHTCEDEEQKFNICQKCTQFKFQFHGYQKFKSQPKGLLTKTFKMELSDDYYNWIKDRGLVLILFSKSGEIEITTSSIQFIDTNIEIQFWLHR